ncbi:right-handed parallel beta-helix repeat-containing protein [bacterium]|nr:right-handed parallel beta-helix repeat-containing protein [bacterium]
MFKKGIVFFFICLPIISALAQTEISGDVWGTWDVSGSPYMVTDDINVPADSVLLIMPGCSVVFTGHFKFRIDSNALLKALGRESAPIMFTATDTLFTDSSGGHHGLRFDHSAPGCSLLWVKIEYGQATDFDNSSFVNDDYGGAIFCWYSDIHLSHSILTHNTATFGGGIALRYSDAEIIENTLIYNRVYSRPNRSGGGGIFCNYSNPHIARNLIQYNVSERWGGGFSCLNCTEFDFDQNLVLANSAEHGGGLEIQKSRPRILNSTIAYNSSIGIYVWDRSDPAFINCLVFSNWGEQGGVRIYGHCYPSFVNCTITKNTGEEYGGGISCCGDADPIFMNSIIYKNRDENGDQIGIGGCISSGYLEPCSLNFVHCAIDTGGVFFPESIATIIWEGLTETGNPFFSDSFNHLGGSSPCIDAGAEYYEYSRRDTLWAPLTDFEGDPRPMGRGWDIGADESPYTEIAERVDSTPDVMEISVHPNPFNCSTAILFGFRGSTDIPLYTAFCVAATRNSNLRILDIGGRVVFESPIAFGQLPLRGGGQPVFYPSNKGSSSPGEIGNEKGEFVWTPEPTLPSGIYLIKADFGEQCVTGRVLYLK